MKTLAIDGKNVSTLYIDGVQVALGEAPTPTVRGLTFQALKAFTDDDLNLSASGTITPEFTVKCYSASGASLGSYTFKQEMTTDTRPSLVSLMKESGIDVDSMKVAGSRFEIVDVKQWSGGSTYVKFNGQTSQCFQIYGSIDESFKDANSGWTLQYMFQSNPTIAAAGFTYANDDGTSVSKRFAYMFSNNTSIKTCVATDENDVEHRMSIGGTGASYCFWMFSGCTSLTTAPELPATSLQYNCYYGMFNGCTSLTATPELPATTLAGSCYYGMFQGCTSLTATPELPASYMKNNCYQSMFDGCTSLTTAPELPATSLQYNCYYGMFNGCTSLTTAPALPATTLAGYCYQSMFSGCTSLTATPELPATTLAGSCYYGMFQGCTSLTTAPALPATTLAGYCYYAMFSGCTSLTTAPALPATTLAGSCYQSMFSGCSKVLELHYAASVETDATFTGMSGTPWFGATNATVYYDL